MADILNSLKLVDEKKTCRKGKEILGSYQRLKLIAGKEYTPKVTSDYSLEPVISSIEENPLDKHLIKKEESIQQLLDIASAINQVSPESKKILIKKYVEGEELNYVLWRDLDMNQSTFYRLLNQALKDFVFAYKSGKEIEYKKLI